MGSSACCHAALLLPLERPRCCVLVLPALHCLIPPAPDALPIATFHPRPNNTGAAQKQRFSARQW